MVMLQNLKKKIIHDVLKDEGNHTVKKKKIQQSDERLISEQYIKTAKKGVMLGLLICKIYCFVLESNRNSKMKFKK